MTRIKIKGFHIFTDRHGKLRCYHRKTGFSIDLAKYPLGSPEFIAQCQRFKPEQKPKTGTLGKLIIDYRSSPSFTSLRQNTRNFYESAFSYLKPIDDIGLDIFDRAFVVRIRDKAMDARGWHFANSVKTSLSTLFSWAVERGAMKENPARLIKRIPRPKGKPRANRPWTDSERYAVLEACSIHLRTPIALMMYLGMDPADAISVLKEQCKDGAISYERTKTGEAVWRPIPSDLKAIMREDKNNAATIAANSYGKPWTRSGLNSVWMPLKAELLKAGKISAGLTLKGLRHTSATIMGEMGYDDRTIADAHGQSTEGMARWYSRDANRKGKMKDVAKRMNAEEKRRKMANLSKKVANPRNAPT